MQRALPRCGVGSTVNDAECLRAILHCYRGCVIAPAGCGKTDKIASAVAMGEGRRLVLTHTLAGVDALRARLKDKEAGQDSYQLTTIAAWSLRLATAFPQRSGSRAIMPRNDLEWNSLYIAAGSLLRSRSIDSIIRASYSGAFVDEYQDCTLSQHGLIRALADLIPCCIFGDHLQSVFGFRNNKLPDWDKEILQAFPVVARLREPWRWKRSNQILGDWLLECRNDLESKGQVDLRGSPIAHEALVGNGNKVHQEKVKLVLKSLRKHGDEKSIIIGNSQNEAGRALLARDVKACAVESITCKRLGTFVKELNRSCGEARANVVLELIKDAVAGADVAALRRTLESVIKGKRRKQLDTQQTACVEIYNSDRLEPILQLLEDIKRKNVGWIYRRELYSVLCAALRVVVSGGEKSLSDAIWDVQNRRRHAGRRFAKRSIGSTLLVKGLEFDHAIIVDVEQLTRNELYVALTRGSHTVTVISKSPILQAASR